MLAGELREEEQEGEGETLHAILQDENSELEPSGIRLGVREGDLLLAGNVERVTAERSPPLTSGFRSWFARARLTAARPHDSSDLRATVQTDTV